MARIFQLNGANLTRLTGHNWIDEPGDDQGLDGVTPLARWRTVISRATVLSATEWNTLQAALGARVSIAIPPYENRNAADYRTYYGVEFEQLEGEHTGPAVENVTAIWRVRL
jgi:hypothetical protein